MSSCGCNSPSSGSPPAFNSFTGSLCPMPQRTSTAPTVPQRFNWLPMAVPKSSGQALVRVSDEMGVLDSPVDGTVMFDSGTGNIFVGQPTVTWIPDNYACTDGPLYGYPVYALRPECGASNSYPARDLAIVRPESSPTGTLWAHQWSCGGIGGPAQEITPVEIEPDALPDAIPADLQYLSYIRTEATVCGKRSSTFYANPGVFVAPNSKVLLVDLPNRPLTENDDKDLRMAAWAKLDDGRFILKSISNSSFQAYINTAISSFLDDGGYEPNYLNPRAILVSQVSNEIFPFIYGPFDLTDYPGYTENAKEVQLFIRTNALTASAGGQVYNFLILVNNVVKYTSYCGPDPFGVQMSAEITVPIPANKQLMIEVQKLIVIAGGSGPPSLGGIEISLEAFK